MKIFLYLFILRRFDAGDMVLGGLLLGFPSVYYFELAYNAFTYQRFIVADFELLAEVHITEHRC